MQSSYETLVSKLNRFVREYYKNLIIRGCVYSVLSMLCLLILLATVEHFSFLGGQIRGGLFWSYCLLTALLIIRFIVVPGLKMLKLTDHLTHKQAAEIIGLHFGDVADKLTNILELKNIGDGSRALIEASINQKIKDIQFTPFNKAIDWGSTINYAKYLIIPAILFSLFFVSGNKEVLSGGTFRIINYNTHFEKPAPFYFKITNDNLTAIEKSNFTIHVDVFGDELPKEVYINYNAGSKKMTQCTKTSFSHEFNGVENNIKFFFSANSEYSKEYEIGVLGRPEIDEVAITVVPPKHTGLNNEKHINSGSLSVPKGSILIWEIKTEKTDTLQLKTQNNISILTKQKEDYFKVEKRIRNNTKYEITLANSNVSFIDTLFYDIGIFSDSHPSISIYSESAKNNRLPIIAGSIRDDYGFSKLESFLRIHGLGRDTLIKRPTEINNKLRSQSFVSPFNGVDLEFEAGEILDFYFIVTDNDAPNQYKETVSETITFNAPTIEEFQEEYEEQNREIKNDITAEMSMLKNLEKELSEFEKELIEKDSLDWRDRKKLEDILKKQSGLEKKIDELKKSSEANFDQLNALSTPTPEILKKQEALKKLFNEIMPDEMKQLYRELSELKDQLQKDDLQQKLKDLQLSNEDLEKELDRNLEILKQLEFDQKLQTIIEKLKSLKNNQIDLAGNLDQKLDKKIEEQQKNIEDFKKIQEDIVEMKNLNKSLEKKQKISKTSDLEDAVKNELNSGKENLEKNRKNRASKSQKEAGEKLQQLASFFEKMQKEEKESQHYEDMDVLRQILENLVYFSIEEENLFLEFQKIDKDDPQYVELMHKQQGLRDATVVIEDSLFALSKRVPQISSKINREINSIDKKTGSAIDYLRERLTPKAVQEQQFIMTSANNLAVLLSNILEQMQQDLASELPSTQQCEKPGKGAPKPGDLKKMQQQLSEHLKMLQQEIQDGNKNDMQKNGMSQKLVEMLAKQELIRESLEELRGQMNTKDGLKSLEKAIGQMEKNEADLANKQLTLESLSRQKEILTRLLEVETALREQGEDEKRESKTATKEYDRIIQNVYEKYELQKLKQTELLKTAPPQLNKYYKKKVDRYFNLMLQ